MLKRVFAINMLFASILGSICTYSEAADVNISGKVIAASCTINSILGGGQEINLGELGRTHLQSPNEGGNWISFSLTLSACPLGTQQASVTFTGSPDSNNPSLFANTEPMATAATGISVQLAKDSDHSDILSSNSTMTVEVDEMTRTASFPLAARLYTPLGGAQAGKVSSSVLVNFTYQ